MLEVGAAANSRCSSGAATASGASDANGTAAPATNVSASLGGGGGAVVVPPASHTSAAFGGAGLATDEVRVSHDLREAASEALLAAAKEEESPRLTGWLATPPTKTAAFLLQLENGGRMTRANAATVLAALEAALGADGELVRAWRLQAVLGPSAVAAEGALALPRTAGLRGGMPPKGVAAKRGGDGGGGSGRGRGGGGGGRGRGTVAAGRGKAPAVDKRKADAVASNNRAVSGGGGASKRPKASTKALTCDESDSCSDGKAKAVASESDSEMADDEPVPVPAKTSSEDVAAAIVGEHGGGEVAAACSAAVAGTTPTPVKPRPLTLNPQQREDERRKAARVLAKASSALLPSTKPAAPPKPNGRDDGGAARGDSSSGHGEAVRTGAGAAAGAAAPAAGNAPAEVAANAAAEAEGSPEDSTDEAAAAGSSTAPAGVYVVGLAESGGASVLREAGGSADPVSAGGGALSTASSAAVTPPAAAAAASTAAAAASTAASHVTIAEHYALKLKYDEVFAQLLKKTAENRCLLDQNERLLFAAADKCSICQDTIQQRATVNCDAKHAFCKGCIHPWLTKMSSACPNCKCEVTELRCPPDAEKSEAIEPRQQRHPDDVTPLDPAAAVEHEEDFLADQRDLRRTFNVDGDGGGEEAPGWAGYVEQGSAPERREERSQQRRVAAAAGERQPRAGEVAEAEGEPSHEMEVEEQEASALRPRGSLPLPNFQQLEWRLDGVPEDVRDVIVANDGVTQQLYDIAVAAGTLLVRTEDEAEEWEARRSPLPPAAFSNLSGCTHSPSPRPTRDSSRRPRRRRASRPARMTTALSSGKRPGLRGPSSRAMVSRSSTR